MIPAIAWRAVRGDLSVMVPKTPATVAPIRRTRATSVAAAPAKAAQNKPPATMPL
jgi:hypothetical protein